MYKRRCRIQTPCWADLIKIKEVYSQAQKLGLTVDHIIPLNGKLVCGLHVENNLQLLTRAENSAKLNKF
jgi:5-methylcytosine-specific restriction endonuclease McrA